MKWLRGRRVRIAIGLVLLVVLLQATPLSDLVSMEALAHHRETLAGFVARDAVFAVTLYVALYVGLVALSLPGATVMTLAGGMLFGPAAGTALAAVSATTGAALVFLLARRIFGADGLHRLGPLGQRIAAGIRRDAVSYLLSLRLVPLFPFVLVNLVPAFVGVPLKVFIGTTLIGMLPVTAVFALAGAGLGEVLAEGGAFDLTRVLTPEVLAALLLLALLSLATIPLRRRLRRD